MQNWERLLDSRTLALASNAAHGQWLADMADWRYFITLTHRRPTSTLSTHTPYTRVGLVRHNRMVRSWFHDDVRLVDSSARMWGETESHVAGGFHEHLLLACAENSGVYAWMQAWFDRRDGGHWDCQPFAAGGDRARRVELAAMYIEKAAKYAGKMASQPPKVWGFGLHASETHSLTLKGAMR